MERVRLIFEQIDEAKRFLLDGSVLNLRLAIILLDNAGELIMNRELQHRFVWDDQLKLASKTNDYTAQERSDSERFFDAKVRLLVRMEKVSKDQESVLDACHQFRGEMFHAEHIRRPILRPATILLFHTVIDLALQMPPHGYLLPGPSDQQHVAFLQRFGLANSLVFGTHFLNPIAAAVRKGVDLESDVLPKALSEDLMERIESTINGLSYLNEEKGEDEVDYRLRYHQFWQTEGYKLAEKRIGKTKLDEAFLEWNSQGRARFTLRKLRRWLKTSELLGKCAPPVALRHYCGVDKKFRALEEDVDWAVFDHDELMNMKIKDRHR